MNFLQSSGGLSNIANIIKNPEKYMADVTSQAIKSVGRSPRMSRGSSRGSSQLSNDYKEIIESEVINNIDVAILRLWENETPRQKIEVGERITVVKENKDKLIKIRLPSILPDGKTDFIQGENFELNIKSDKNSNRIRLRDLIKNNDKMEEFYKKYIDKKR